MLPADRIECAQTGFYQNPDDCRTFVACILDAHVRRPYMHLMRCPEGLVWDNTDKICNQYSTTCNIGTCFILIRQCLQLFIIHLHRVDVICR